MLIPGHKFPSLGVLSASLPGNSRAAGVLTLCCQVWPGAQKVGERCEHYQSVMIFLQAPVANFAIAEDPLDCQKRLLDFGPNTGLHSLDLMQQTVLVLSVIAHAGTEIQSDMEQAFGAAAQVLGLSGLVLLGKDQIKVSDLALGKLEQLKPLAKSRLLKACAASIWHARRATPVEVELLRAFASVLDCPMPPAIP